MLVVAFAAGTLVVVSCAKPGSAAPAKSGRARALPVTAAPAVTKSVARELNTFGTAQAVASVAIKAQVGELLKKVHFEKGQKIARGQLLFSLETKPFEVALQQARAALARDTAQAANAKLEAARMQALIEKKIAAQTDADKANAAAAALVETVKADEAAIAALQLDLDHCGIYSPIDGRAGNILVHEGNLVKANDVPLVLINQVSPIDVFFAIPQRDLGGIRTYMAEGDLPVEAIIPDDPDHPEKGRLTFVDNAVDADTGTIQLGALFPNANERLWPGQYVRVRLSLTVQKNATVVPTRAVQTGNSGKYVFVVRKDQTVELRPVKTGHVSGGDTVIEEGLQPEEQVVTDGHLQLIEGATVEVRAEAAAELRTPPAAAPAAGKRAAP